MKTAILMSGFMRTWHICKDALVDAITTVYGKDVDWYVIFWDTKTSTYDEVGKFFTSKSLNLIHLEFVDQSKNLLYEKGKVRDSMWQITDSISGPGYLRQKISKIKRLYEYQHGIVYDRVIYSRPDIIYYYHPQAIEKENEFYNLFGEPGNLTDFAMHIRGDFKEVSHELISPHTHDLMPIAGMFSSDLYGFMYIDANDSYKDIKVIKLRNGETHAWVSMYLNKHLISRDHRATHNCLINYITPIVLRPSSDIDKFLSGYKNWNLEWMSAGEHDSLWVKRENFHEKIEYCRKFNIDLDDYGLSKFIKYD